MAGGARTPCSFPATGGWPRALAEAGFVVVEVIHSQTEEERLHACAQLGYSGSCASVSQAQYWNRPKDIAFVIDSLSTIGNTLNDYQGNKIISRMDVNRVGVAGHSNGAYTAMTVAGAQPKMGPSNTAQNFKYVGTASRPAPLAYLAASVQGENDHGFFRTSASSHSWVSVVSPNAEERPVMTITGYDDCPGATAAVCHDATDPLDPESSLNRVTAFENMQAVSGADDKIQVWVDVADAEHPDFNLKTDTGTYDAQIFDVVEAAGKAWFDAILNSNAGAFTYLRSDKLKTLMPAGAKLPGDSSAVDICRANLVQ